MKILLADDHKILREGLKALLNRHPHMRVEAEASNGEEALALARELPVDVVIMDVIMPGMNGIDATRLLKKEFPCLNIVGLSMYSNANFIYELFKAGASGFLIKDCAFDELIDAVLAAGRGEKYISECLKGSLSDMFLSSLLDAQPHGDEDISLREIEILTMLAEGLTNKEVAEKLFLSVNTVACHRQNIMKKLGIKNAVELTKYALRKGYVSL